MVYLDYCLNADKISCTFAVYYNGNPATLFVSGAKLSRWIHENFWIAATYTRVATFTANLLADLPWQHTHIYMSFLVYLCKLLTANVDVYLLCILVSLHK